MNTASEHPAHRNDSHLAASEHPLPQPTIAPVTVAFGVMLLPWGILTHGIVTLVGVCLITWAIAIWINEIRKEWSADDRTSTSGTESPSL